MSKSKCHCTAAPCTYRRGKRGAIWIKSPIWMQITKPEGLGESGGVEDDLLSATGHLECQSKPFEVLHHLTPAYLSRLSPCTPLHPTDGTGTCFLTHPMLFPLSGLPGPSSWSSKATFKAKILFPNYSPVHPLSFLLIL